MKSLELKIPPPVIAVLVAAAMWVLSRLTPSLRVPTGIRLSLSLVFVIMGVGSSAAGLIAFRRAKTTLNPTKPETTSSLVKAGIYTVTRNPMYVGLLLLLIALAMFASSPWALLGPAAYFFYVGRFQIIPEERALTVLFGAEYTAYASKVSRWL